jgi:Fe-Mn family superoxide dismutase
MFYPSYRTATATCNPTCPRNSYAYTTANITKPTSTAQTPSSRGLDKSRREKLDVDVKASLKELSWNVAGHLLHSLFWENLAPPSRGGGEPGGKLADKIVEDFGSFERFKKEFSQAAISVEGSGWAALTLCRQTGRLMLMQVEKHNVNVYPAFPILMVLDVFEHAYYIDYKNDRGKFVEAFWNIVNWDTVGKRLGDALK